MSQEALKLFRFNRWYSNCARGCCGSTEDDAVVVATTPREAYGFILERYTEGPPRGWHCEELTAVEAGILEGGRDRTAELYQ